MTHIVIIGAGYAGMIAAQRLAKWTNARLTLINAAAHFVERIRLHQVAAGQAIKAHALSSLLNRRIELIIATVTHINPDQHALDVSINGEEKQIRFDYLVYALGSTSNADAIPGASAHAYALNAHSALKLAEKLPRAQHVLVVGGGLTAIETVTELAEAYPQSHFTCVTRGRLGAALSAPADAYLRRTFDRLHIRLLENQPVQGFSAQSAHLANGETLAFDVGLWAGAFAVPQLAAQAGLHTNAAGQIIVDDMLRSVSHPHIFAAGDSASFTHRPPLRMACATALPMGCHVAESLSKLLAQQTPSPFRFGYVVQCISLGRADALVQSVNHNDYAQPRIWTGRIGALIKEAICQMTFRSIHWERYAAGLYRYPQPPLAAPQTDIRHEPI